MGSFLNSIKAITFNDEKRSLIFDRPEKVRGYKNVYRIIGDDLIQQQH